MQGKDQTGKEGGQLIAERISRGWDSGKPEEMEKDEIHQDGAGHMEGKIEQVVAENVQAPQVKIQGEASHEQWPVTARLRVNPAAHLGLEEELGIPPGP
jgi:hypothetical protein